MNYVVFVVVLVIQLGLPISLHAQFKLVSSIPQHNELDFPKDQAIKLTFNASVDPSTVNAGLRIWGSLSGKINYTSNVVASLLTIIPQSSLHPDENISVELLPALHSITGTALGARTLLSFTIHTGTSPFVPPVFIKNTLNIWNVSLMTENNRSIAQADLDLDGDIDLIVTSTSSSIFEYDLDWLENNGDGSFQSHKILKDADPMFRIMTADIDYDGDIDILGASSSSGIVWLQNDGTQYFSSSTIEGTSGRIFDIEVVDLDMNGLHDIVYTIPSYGTFVAFREAGAFNNVKVSTSLANQNICADLDNDGDIDIVQRDWNTVKWLRNSDGVFEELSISTDDFAVMVDLVVVDMNDDAILDLVVGKSTAVEVMINDGVSQFTPYSLVSGISNSFGTVGVADYDGDGDHDIVFSNNGLHYILTNDGNANFQRTAAEGSNGYISTSVIVSADFDDDGDLDFVSSEQKQLMLYKNTTLSEVIPFSDVTPADFKSLTYANADWGDYDNDGDLDLLMIGRLNEEHITLLYENKAGNLVKRNSGIPGYSNGSCDWGDFDRDGDLDVLISGTNDQYNPRTVIYINTDGVFTLLPSSVDQLPFVEDGETRWADFDNDGLLDIAVVSLYSSGLYRSTGNGNFIKEFDLPSTQNLDIGDYDHDGDLDIACGAPIVFRNDRNWNFASVDIINSVFGHLTWADLKNSGDLELIAAWNTTLGVYQQDGERFSGSYRNDYLTYQTFASSVGDLNNDGFVDLVTSSSFATSTLDLLINDRAGNLIYSKPLVEMKGSLFTALADYDSDHDLDILEQGNWLRNNAEVKNHQPAPPTHLQLDSIYNNSIYFHWTTGTDNETSAPGLSYQIYAGTDTQKQDVVNAQASLSTGFRKKAASGNVKGTNTRVENLGGGDYFLGVQSVDAAFEGSIFSDELKVSVVGIHGGPAVCSESTTKLSTFPKGNYQWEVTGGTIVSGQGTDEISVAWNVAGNAYATILKDGSRINSLEILIEDKKPHPVITGFTDVCIEGTSQYILSDPQSYYTQWTVTGPDTINAFLAETHSFFVNGWPETAGNYLIKAKTFSKYQGCSNYDTARVTVHAHPDKPLIFATQPTATLDTLISTPSPNGFYNWYYNGTIVISGEYQGIITPVEGTFMVEVFAGSDCSTLSDPYVVKFSDVVTGISSIENHSFEVYPVPAVENITVKIQHPDVGELNVSIYTVGGTLVKMSSFKKTDYEFVTALDISNLKPGVYVLKVTTSSSSHKRKFVKE